MIIRAVKIFLSVFAHSLVVVLENVVTPPLQHQVFFRVVKNENQLTGFDFNWKAIPTFSYCQIEKRTLSASFCFCFIFSILLNITIQELTHSILILPRQTQLEFTLSLFLRLNYHQTYQLKTCWYSEKCNGRLLYNLDDDKTFCLRKCSN